MILELRNFEVIVIKKRGYVEILCVGCIKEF